MSLSGYFSDNDWPDPLPQLDIWTFKACQNTAGITCFPIPLDILRGDVLTVGILELNSHMLGCIRVSATGVRNQVNRLVRSLVNINLTERREWFCTLSVVCI